MPLHPVLTKLNVTSATALDILNQLLQTNAVSPETLRLVHESLISASTATATTTSEENRRNHLKPPAADDDDKDVKKNEKQKKTPADDGTGPIFRRQRHIAFRIYYDGESYSGLAECVGQEQDRSVERVFFAALERARLVACGGNRRDCGYSRCGRTDRGVSAAGQVVALRVKSAFGVDAAISDDDNNQHHNHGDTGLLTNADLPKNSNDQLTVWMTDKKGRRVKKTMSEYPYEKILNNLLPPEVRVLGWTPVSDDFSARFSTKSRTYRYFFVDRPFLDKTAMQGALSYMVGSHDFRNFCKMDVEKVYNFERTIHSADIVEFHDTVCYFRIVGQAFLWHQIRYIAAIVFLVGRRLEQPDIVQELLDVEKYPGKPAYPLADERPLVLHDCEYSNLQIGYSVSNLWDIVREQERQWEELTLKAARVRSCIESLHGVAVSCQEAVSFCVAKTTQREKKKPRNNGIPMKIDQRASPFRAATTSWKDALDWLKESGLPPDPDKSFDNVYKPLLERSMGTTYEEKVSSLQNSTRRREKYVENVIKKRKTGEEDQEFYDHMSRQGGSAL
jgi:tRNA pseudouridine38/39 synthase